MNYEGIDPRHLCLCITCRLSIGAEQERLDMKKEQTYHGMAYAKGGRGVEGEFAVYPDIRAISLSAAIDQIRDLALLLFQGRPIDYVTVRNHYDEEW